MLERSTSRGRGERAEEDHLSRGSRSSSVSRTRRDGGSDYEDTKKRIDQPNESVSLKSRDASSVIHQRPTQHTVIDDASASDQGRGNDGQAIRKLQQKKPNEPWASLRLPDEIIDYHDNSTASITTGESSPVSSLAASASFSDNDLQSSDSSRRGVLMVDSNLEQGKYYYEGTHPSSLEGMRQRNSEILYGIMKSPTGSGGPSTDYFSRAENDAQDDDKSFVRITSTTTTGKNSRGKNTNGNPSSSMLSKDYSPERDRHERSVVPVTRNISSRSIDGSSTVVSKTSTIGHHRKADTGHTDYSTESDAHQSVVRVTRKNNNVRTDDSDGDGSFSKAAARQRKTVEGSAAMLSARTKALAQISRQFPSAAEDDKLSALQLAKGDVSRAIKFLVESGHDPSDGDVQVILDSTQATLSVTYEEAFAAYKLAGRDVLLAISNLYAASVAKRRHR